MPGSKMSATLLVVLTVTMCWPLSTSAQTDCVNEDVTHIPLGSPVPAGKQRISGRQHFATFSILLPPKWRKTQFRPASAEHSMSVHFEGPDGLYFHVEVDLPGQGVSADTIWDCQTSEDRLLIVSERRLCAPPRAGEEAEADGEGCSAGDGRLDIVCSAEGEPHTFTIVFGNTRKEAGVDLEVFRRIIRDFRVKLTK